MRSYLGCMLIHLTMDLFAIRVILSFPPVYFTSHRADPCRLQFPGAVALVPVFSQ